MAIQNTNGVALPQTTLTRASLAEQYEANDNHIVHGINFEGWTVDAGSTKASAGITVVQNSTSEFAEIDVTGLAANTTYWAMIYVAAKTAGVTGSNGLKVVAAGTDGSNLQAVGGGEISLATAPVGSPYYFKIQTDSTSGPWTLRIKHDGSANGQSVQFSAFNIYPIPTRSSAKVALIGDREGGFTAAYASACNRAIVESAADTKNIVFLGDHGGSNSYETCDVLQLASVVRTSASPTVTLASSADWDLVEVGCGVTGTGIPANTTVSAKLGSNQLTLSQNASSSGTATLSLTSYLKYKVAALGGDRYICIGNHDYDGTNETLIDDYFPTIQTSNNANKFYYSVVLGEMEFFFINDNDSASGNSGQELTDNAGGISATQANFQASTAGQWVLTALAASTATWKIMCIHHPVWSSSSASAGYASNRWAWKTLGFDIVLQAHVHGLERIQKDGLYYFTQAMGGGNHHGWATRLSETKWRLDTTVTSAFATTYGYWKIHDSTTALIFEFFDTSHQLLDRAKLGRA